MGVSAPNQHLPPVYGCAAGAVLHAHSGNTLEPAVLLHTFVPPGVEEALRDGAPVVDVSGDGAGTSTVTVRVLVGTDALSWQLPLAPFVAALPGQPGDEGRMVLLALVDGEPAPGFWATPVDCEQLVSELQLPVADLVEALRGRLTPWLAEDLQVLLHDDEHDRAADQSPAQTLATAVLSHYRGDLAADKQTVPLLRALALAPPAYAVEAGVRLAAALVVALEAAGPAGVEGVLAQTGPFEAEALRLLSALPEVLAAGPEEGPVEATLLFLMDGPDKDEGIRASVSVIARLARAALGPDLPDDVVLRQLGMVDDAGVARLAGLWLALAVAAAGPPANDAALSEDIARRVVAEGRPGLDWLRETARVLTGLVTTSAGRALARAAGAVLRLRDFLEGGTPEPDQVVLDCVALARLARSQRRAGPGSWLLVPTEVAARAVGLAHVEGLDRDTVVDLLAELLEDDVDGVDLLDAFVCATAQLLVHVDPAEDAELRQVRVAEMLAALPVDGPRQARWLLTGCLRLAPEHDPAALDLRSFLPRDSGPDLEKAAGRTGRLGMLGAGLACLDALAEGLGEAAQMGRAELLGDILPLALVEHGLLHEPEADLAE